MPRFILIERRMQKFLRGPASIRNAAAVIVTSTAVVVVASGLLMRVLDHKEYKNIFIGMWWAIQTVTTVGYGDVTPKSVAGRLVATVVMLEGIALVAIVTAAITSTFVARATALQEAGLVEDEKKEDAHVQARFDDLSERLERVETLLRAVADQGS